ncbi:hypothetical protein QNO09_33910 [Streptomyces sp. 378]|uniref:hypothetical protein n=1 Tax=Streptomyces sp. 378 TaxID=3049412 RepID=UPI0024C28084|nr:hypothetical protein [Streptomyces sp. 378]MDK1348186.1 hypothetical protein [Streptomyces sp. 378]
MTSSARPVPSGTSNSAPSTPPLKIPPTVAVHRVLACRCFAVIPRSAAPGRLSTSLTSPAMAVWLSSVGMPGTWTRGAVDARTPMAGATSATALRSSSATAPVPCSARASAPADASSTASQAGPTGNQGRPRSASHVRTAPPTAAPTTKAPIAAAGRATGTAPSPARAKDGKSTLPVASAQNTFSMVRKLTASTAPAGTVSTVMTATRRTSVASTGDTSDMGPV